MKILELFSGTESFSKVARARGHETFTIDNNPKHKPDWCVDIMKVKKDDVLKKFGQPDMVWASPPCENFSILCHKHWENRRPKEETRKSISLLGHTINLILNLFPRFWILENPRGRLRWVLGKPFNTVFYGAYNHPCLKPTDLWGYFPKIKWKFKPTAKLIGFKNWHQKGINKTILRAIVPKDLCLEIIKACEKGLNKEQY